MRTKPKSLIDNNVTIKRTDVLMRKKTYIALFLLPMFTTALAPQAQLRMRSSHSDGESRSSCNPPFHPPHKPKCKRHSTTSTLSRTNYNLWGRRRLLGTYLLSRTKEKSSFDASMEVLDDASDEYNDLETSEKGIINKNICKSTDTTSSPAELLWGIPIQSVILLNLVAVIWGTQHAVIKSVVDDSTTIGLGAGFVKSSMDSMGINLSTVQTNVVSGSDGDSNTAAYFTMARFGLAALLASPYTPGIKETFGFGKSLTSVGDVNGSLESEGHTQPQQSSTSAKNTESVRLAWRWGAELGIYMFLGYAFQAIGLATTTASRSGFLLYLNVKFVPFFSYFLFGKSIQASTIASALVAFSGTALLAFDNVNAESASELGMSFTVGDLWSIAAAAVSAMFILRMEAASKAVPNSSELNAANLWTVAVLSFLWTMSLSYQSIDADTMTAFVHAMQQTFHQTFSTIISHPLPLIYLSGVTTALANFIQSKAQKDVSAERASVIYAMDPVYGALFANILLGETLGGFGLLGAFLIVVAAATNAVLDFGGQDKELTKEKR